MSRLLLRASKRAELFSDWGRAVSEKLGGKSQRGESEKIPENLLSCPHDSAEPLLHFLSRLLLDLGRDVHRERGDH